MKRFKVQPGDGRTLLLYYPTRAEAQERWPEAVVEESDDLSHLEYIHKMLAKAVSSRKVEGNGVITHVLRFDTLVGICFVQLIQGRTDDMWYDICKYQLWKTGAVVVPFGWNVANPADFCKLFIFPKAEYAVLTKDSSEPKPKELRGVKKFASIPFGSEQRKCQLYLKGDDLYINHADYFSPTGQMDKINPYTHLPERIVYIRKVWLRITNFVPMVKILNASQISKKVWTMIQGYYGWLPTEYNFEWERFLEDVAKTTMDYITDHETNISCT